jgi:hypothetical protein
MGTRAPELSLVVRPAAGGPDIAAPTSPFVSSRYSTGSRRGYSILGFSAPADGRYELEASAPSVKGPVPGVLQVAPAFGLPRLLLTILGSVAILAAGVGGGVALIVKSAPKP